MRVFVLACGLALLSAPAGAAHIGIFTDANSRTCTLTPGGVVTIYVVALHSSGFRGAAFKVDAALPSGIVAIGASPIGFICVTDCNPYEGTGAVRDCSTADYPMYALMFLTVGPPDGSTCNHLTVTAHPNASTPLLQDCAGDLIEATGGFFSFVPGPGYCNDCALATEPTTWGSVKALYR